MTLYTQFYSFIHYLIHPFKTHDSFLHPDRVEGYRPVKLSAYESLSFSWVFIILNGIFKVLTLNSVAFLLLNLLSDPDLIISQFIDVSQFPIFHFMLLSIVLDIIFYPLFGIIIIQYWEFVFKFFGYLLEVGDDATDRAHSILAVYFSSSIFKIIPILGQPLHSLSSMVLMYAGLRKQLGASPILSICIIFTPFLMMLMFFSAIFLIFLMAI